MSCPRTAQKPCRLISLTGLELNMGTFDEDFSAPVGGVACAGRPGRLCPIGRRALTPIGASRLPFACSAPFRTLGCRSVRARYVGASGRRFRSLRQRHLVPSHPRSEDHTSQLPSLMPISYSFFFFTYFFSF